jgi:hypothetical protein
MSTRGCGGHARSEKKSETAHEMGFRATRQVHVLQMHLYHMQIPPIPNVFVAFLGTKEWYETAGTKGRKASEKQYNRPGQKTVSAEMYVSIEL